MLHFFHDAKPMYSVHPGPEPGETEPGTLYDIGQSALPVGTFGVKPTHKDQPRLRHFIYPTAPTPLKHTLSLEHVKGGSRHHDVWFGTVPYSMMDIRVTEKVALEVNIRVAPKVHVASWDIDHSLWRPRKRATDSRSYWDTHSVYERGFQMDWVRAINARVVSVMLPSKARTDRPGRLVPMSEGAELARKGLPTDRSEAEAAWAKVRPLHVERSSPFTNAVSV